MHVDDEVQALPARVARHSRKLETPRKVLRCVHVRPERWQNRFEQKEYELLWFIEGMSNQEA